MYPVRFLPDDRFALFNDNDTLLSGARRSGLPLMHVCGGHGRCSTCRVLVVEGADSLAPRTAAEEAVARDLGFDPSIRLACQCRVLGPATVRRLVLDENDVAVTSRLLPGSGTGKIGVESEVGIIREPPDRDGPGRAKRGKAATARPLDCQLSTVNCRLLTRQRAGAWR